MGRKPTNKKRADNPEIRKRWIEKLTPLYMSGQLTSSTMSEISAILEVSKATLYKYFSSRREILESVIDLKISEVGEFNDALFDEQVPYEERYFKAMQVASIRMAGISNQFLLALKLKYPDLWQKIDAFTIFAVSRLEQFYILGLKQGILKDFSPKMLAITDQIFISALSDPQFLIENELSLQETLKNYFLIKSNGIFKKELKHE